MKLGRLSRVFVLATLLGAIAVFVSGCHGGSPTSGPMYQAWYDVYGNRCGTGQPSAGCNFYWDGSKVIDSSDPYYYSSYNIQYNTWLYTDSYGYSRSYVGWAWLSPTGILYDQYGNALNEDGEKDGVDEVANAAATERNKVLEVGKNTADRYGLTEDTGIRIATTLNDFAVIGKTRARTEADIADFTKRLYGVSVEATTQALDQAKTGNGKALEGLNGEVANYWGTNPETSKAILKNWFKDQASEYNVK